MLSKEQNRCQNIFQVSLTASLPKNDLAIIADRAHSLKLEATPKDPTAKPRVVDSVGSLCTPTLIRPDNEREGWVMSHKLDLTVRCIGERAEALSQTGSHCCRG